ncbi:CGNR zinc finger domain-containing protein [Mycobacterium sp. GA-2829]|uniref:CGNR zinc finger domain-containing protein n=1 Tax=Mycobacterium sp. GA-2829 TaxID=1772283 RepID=UPI00073FC0D2|nr:CGNR zinc finger domain-containing protein [Mycobacterium sp. GA-2829]KUI35005.1 RNA-binding protein [Mycobacterium sp. GA-2829]
MTREPGQWTADNEVRPAPAPLDRVQSLVNTVDMEIGQDRLARLEDARPWLVGQGLLDAGADAALTEGELGRIREVREAFRALLVHNAGGPPAAPDQVAVLAEVAAAGELRAAIGGDGVVAMRAVGTAPMERLAELLVVVRDAQRDGTWERLKACGNVDCRWAFYDRSRNRGGAWCDMAACGNRLKNRDFRARNRAAGSDRQVPDQGGRQRAHPVE